MSTARKPPASKKALASAKKRQPVATSTDSPHSGIFAKVLADCAKTSPLTQAAVKSQTPTPALTLLQRAEATINGPRQKEYGDKLQNFSQIAMIWQGLLAHKLMPGQKILPEDVAAMMIGVKLARVAKTPDHFDSWLDVAGYAGCVDRLQAERIAETELLGATEDAGAFIAKQYDKPA